MPRTLITDGYEQLAHDCVQAFDARDGAALQRVNAHYERSYTFDDLAAEIGRRVYAFRQRSLRGATNYLHLDEARTLLAQDAGFSSWFRHVGRCERLERLTCMYCRDTTDEATSHIAGLHLCYYYAGLTQITDRSLELLGQMSSLEQVEFYECAGVTDADLPHLARLPRLREVALDSLPGVTLSGTKVFPAQMRVRYTT